VESLALWSARTEDENYTIVAEYFFTFKWARSILLTPSLAQVIPKLKLVYFTSNIYKTDLFFTFSFQPYVVY
jgi:hypothetical protein